MKKGVDLDLGSLNPKQQLFVNSRTLYTAYGGAKGGGKTHAIRYKAVGGAVHWPGIKILIIRRTYPELQKNHIDPIIKMLHPLIKCGVAKPNNTDHSIRFQNGSIIQFGHYQGKAAEEEYAGIEYDWIFMDEATQFTEREFRNLGGLLRGVNEIPKRFYLTCNPGGVGHRWVKRLFIDKNYKCDSLNWEENENPEDYNFIFASIEDNTAMREKAPIAYEQYLRMLSSLPENIREAYRYGKWDELGGNYFPEFSEAKHVIKLTNTLPEHWARYRSFDYGLDMLACYWWAIDTYGRCYCYRELKAKNLIVSDAARLIKDCTLPNEHITVTFVPPDMWNRQKDTGKTMAEDFMLNGISILKADDNRVQGHMQIKEMLKDAPDGKPLLQFTNECKGIIEDIQSIQADETNPNDCAKEPHEITHTVDGIRYFCVSRTLPTDTPQEPPYREDNEEDYDEYMTGGEVSQSYIMYNR